MKSPLWRILLFLSWIVGLYFALVVAPDDATLGVSQRIFYPHVGAAWVGFAAFTVTFIMSILYLKNRRPEYDLWAGASAEVGTVFTTTVLVTGTLWGRVAWGTWWTWDPRLTTTIVLWFLYIGYLLIREATEGHERRAVFASVYGIIAFFTVPLDFFSIRWWNTIHPTPITAHGIYMAPLMIVAMLIFLLAFSLLYVDLMNLRVLQARVAEEIAERKERLRARF